MLHSLYRFLTLPIAFFLAWPLVVQADSLESIRTQPEIRADYEQIREKNLRFQESGLVVDAARNFVIFGGLLIPYFGVAAAAPTLAYQLFSNNTVKTAQDLYPYYLPRNFFFNAVVRRVHELREVLSGDFTLFCRKEFVRLVPKNPGKFASIRIDRDDPYYPIKLFSEDGKLQPSGKISNQRFYELEYEATLVWHEGVGAAGPSLFTIVNACLSDEDADTLMRKRFESERN